MTKKETEDLILLNKALEAFEEEVAIKNELIETQAKLIKELQEENDNLRGFLDRILKDFS